MQVLDQFSWITMLKYLIFLFFMIMGSMLYADSHHPQQFLDEIKGKPDEGMRIVNHFCSNCHADKPLIELGAPKMNNNKDWQTRLMKMGFEGLITNTIEGVNAMPARGGCFECSDEQLKKAIIELLPLSLQKNYKAHKKNK